jgi:hypothetical protein
MAVGAEVDSHGPGSPPTRPAHRFRRNSIPTNADHDMPLPPPMSARLSTLTFSESSGRYVNPANALTAVRLASIDVTDTFGVLNSTVFDRVNVRSPPITANFALSLTRYEAPASKNVLSTSTSPWTVVASGPCSVKSVAAVHTLTVALLACAIAGMVRIERGRMMRSRRLYRSRRHATRAVRAGRQGNDFSRRDRRLAARAAGQTPAPPAGR